MTVHHHSPYGWHVPSPQGGTSLVERLLVRRGVASSTHSLKAFSYTLFVGVVSLVYSLLALSLPAEVSLGEDTLRPGETVPAYVEHLE